MPVRLHRRILLHQLPLLLVLFVGVLWWLGSYLEDVLLSANLASAQQSSQIAVYAVEASMRAEQSHRVWDGIVGAIPLEAGSEIEIVDAAGTVIFSTDESRAGLSIPLTDSLCSSCHAQGDGDVSTDHTFISDPAENRFQVYAAPLLNGEECRVCHAAEGEKLGMVLVRQNLAPARAQVRTAMTALVIGGLAALILTMLTTRFLLARYLGRPLRRLLAGAEAIGSGQLSHRVELPQETELTVLANTLNASSERLSEMMNRLERQRDDSQALYRLVDQLSREVRPEERRRRAVELAGKVLGTECLLVRAGDEWEGGGVTATYPDGGLITEMALSSGFDGEGLPSYFLPGVVERWMLGNLDGVFVFEAGDTVAHPVERKGRRLALLITSTPRSAPDPEMIRALLRHIGIALEFSELQRDLVEEERMAAIGETTAGLAHWLKNTLNGLRAGQYVIDRAVELDDREKFRKGWAVMKKSVHRVEKLTADLLYSARRRTPHRQPVDPNDIVREVVEMMAEKAARDGVLLDADLDIGVGAVPLESESIHRALLNLVTNAVEACAETDRDGKVIARCRAEGESLVLSVQDNGAGITESIRGSLFRRYFSTKGSKGTGLGLMVVHKIAEEHGGSVEVESRAGVGSTFRLRLPRMRQDGRTIA